jgi:sugar O-acyltransferase (sialic acid O-acetyltransferase NeuD family)
VFKKGMKKNLIVIGAGGHGQVIADLALNLNYNASFWDENPSNFKGNFQVENVKKIVPPLTSLVIGIGANSIREQFSLYYPANRFVSLKHPNAIIADSVEVGTGTVILTGSVINRGVKIGHHCIVNTASVIDHDCIISDFVHISPNTTICGNVTVGRGTWVGAGAIIIQGINVGKNVTIGAGSVIIKDIPDNATVVGNPGRIIKIGGNNYE